MLSLACAEPPDVILYKTLYRYYILIRILICVCVCGQTS
jgi:hypothetical protein